MGVGSWALSATLGVEMLSESARMSSAAEARFRIPVPAATARAVKVIALDPACDGVVSRLAENAWNRTTVVPSSVFAARTRNLLEEVAAADLVAMVVTAGADAQVAASIGGVCSLKQITTACVVVGAASVPAEVLSWTLAQVHPWSLMVVITNDDSYVEDILRSFR